MISFVRNINYQKIFVQYVDTQISMNKFYLLIRICVCVTCNIFFNSDIRNCLNISQAEFSGERMSVPRSKTCRKELKHEILFFKKWVGVGFEPEQFGFRFFFNNKMLYYRWHVQYMVLSKHSHSKIRYILMGKIGSLTGTSNFWWTITSIRLNNCHNRSLVSVTYRFFSDFDA